jgi:hypothetical protein
MDGKQGEFSTFFVIQLKGGIPTEQPQFLIFFCCCILSRNAAFSKTCHRLKIVTPKPSTIRGHVNDSGNLREYSSTLVLNSWLDYTQNSPSFLFLLLLPVVANYRS